MVQFNLINCFSINHATATLIDAKMYLFHVERHVKDVVLVSFYTTVTQITSPQCFGSGGTQVTS